VRHRPCRTRSEKWKMCKNIIFSNYFSFLWLLCSVADPDPGSGIRWLFDPWIRIRDPGLTSGSYFRELRNNFLGYKYLNY
jgi:hypothetical protein